MGQTIEEVNVNSHFLSTFCLTLTNKCSQSLDIAVVGLKEIIDNIIWHSLNTQQGTHVVIVQFGLRNHVGILKMMDSEAPTIADRKSVV